MPPVYAKMSHVKKCCLSKQLKNVFRSMVKTHISRYATRNHEHFTQNKSQRYPAGSRESGANGTDTQRASTVQRDELL